VQGGLRVSRWWLVLLAPIALLSMLSGATPAGQTYAQSPPTPTFVWLVPHGARGACGNGARNNDNCLHVDPINQQFVYYPDQRTPNATPIAAKVRDMEVSQQRVSWKWNDPTRTYFVWGSVDRVRKTVRMTLWRRERNGVAQTHLFNTGTPRTMPLAADPRILIQDNKFVPNRLVINRGQQVNFQNRTREKMVIVFSRSPGGIEPSNLSWVFRPDFCSVLVRCELPANTIAPPFPVRPPNPPTPLPDADPPVFWSGGPPYQFFCSLHPNFKPGFIVIRDG
jgi:hypothetical protein